MTKFFQRCIGFVCLAFSIIVLAYLLFFNLLANISSPSLIPALHSYNLKILLTVLCTAGVAIFAYRFLDDIFLKCNLVNEKMRYLVLLLISFLLFSFIAYKTPFAPNNDSADILDFLNKTISGKLNNYMITYLNFWATNRLTLLAYYPFVKLFGVIQTGVQAANFLFVFSSITFISLSCRKMFGYKIGEFSLFILIPICPFILLLGPYIYPIAIFLSSLCFFLYLSNNKFCRIMFYILSGFVFVLRPTAMVYILVFVFVHMLITKGKFLPYFLKLFLIIISCFIIKISLGNILYYTKIHPYPDFNNSASLWTFEIGTRNQKSTSGVCSYTPYNNHNMDEIATGFSQLWKYYEKSDPTLLPQIKQTQAEINQNIKQRYISLLTTQPKLAIQMYAAKFYNFYRDRYRPYYYGVNINAPDYAKNLYKNYDNRYFLYENVILVMFYLVSVILLIFCLFKRKIILEQDNNIVALIAGATATALVFLILTEVMKRYLFDFFVPMSIIIVYALGRLATMQISTNRKLFNSLLSLILSFLFGFGIFMAYNSFNLELLKNCSITVEEAGLNKQKIKLKLKKPCLDENFKIVENYTTVIPMYGKDTFETTFDVYSNKNVPFEIVLPSGESFEILKIKLYNKAD